MRIPKPDLANLYHELAQNAVVDALKSYLQNVSGILRPLGRPPKKKKNMVITDEVIFLAENVERELDSVHSVLMSELQNGEHQNE